MTKQKPRPCIGDTAWFVEWCHELAFDGDELDRDNCKHRTRRASSREDAERIAREVYPEAVGKFGVVEFWPAEFMAYDEDDADLYPHAGYWDATGDTEYYEGE